MPKGQQLRDGFAALADGQRKRGLDLDEPTVLYRLFERTAEKVPVRKPVDARRGKPA